MCLLCNLSSNCVQIIINLFSDIDFHHLFHFFTSDGKDDDRHGDNVRPLLAAPTHATAGGGGTYCHLRLSVFPDCLDNNTLASHVLRLLQPYRLFLDEQTL